MNARYRRAASPRARLIQQDIAKTDELIQKYNEFFDRMDAHMASLNINLSMICSRLDTIPSQMEAMQYKLDDFQRSVANLQSSIYSLQEMQYHFDPLVHLMTDMNGKIHSEFFELQKNVKNMESIVKVLDEISKDPVINRTIDELRDISGRVV